MDKPREYKNISSSESIKIEKPIKFDWKIFQMIETILYYLNLS